MPKLFTSLVTVQFACNNHEANSREDYIAEEISEALAKNNIDNSAISWDIDCNVLELQEDL